MGDIWQAMAARWPSAIVSRGEIGRFTGGAVSSKSLANEDCNETGPQGRFCIGRRVCYPVDSLIQWLKSRATGN